MTKFTLTSKVKKKPLYYNMQVSVDKDCSASDFGSLLPSSNFYFYKDSPIIYTFRRENYWQLSGREGVYINTFNNGETTTTNMFSLALSTRGISYLIGDGTGYASKENEYFEFQYRVKDDEPNREVQKNSLFLYFNFSESNCINFHNLIKLSKYKAFFNSFSISSPIGSLFSLSIFLTSLLFLWLVQVTFGALLNSTTLIL